MTHRMAFVLGIVWWTLLEYLLHRFAFHARSRLFGRRHLRHHADVDVRRLAVAPVASMVGGGLANGVALVALFGARTGGLAFAGMLLGYGVYELTHYAVHYVKLDFAWFRALKRYHLSHHFQAPHGRYGVTSPLWDLVFGTFRLPPRREAAR
jgi:sterol desaturase/sphingolipid hydroxylase (fatty acid hydroxylase superfamily)